jgi:hypothetical protein
MSKIQATPIPEFQKSFLIQAARDFRAALSYVSFYSSDSPFVIQAVQKLHKDLLRLLQSVDPLVLHLQKGKLFANDSDFSELGDLLKILQEKNIPGVVLTKGLVSAELSTWLRRITQPFEQQEEAPEPMGKFVHITQLTSADFMTILTEASSSGEVAVLSPSEAGSNSNSQSPHSNESSPFSLDTLLKNEPSQAVRTSMPLNPEASLHANEALLSFVAEAWQFSQLQKKAIGSSPEMAGLTQSFEKLFDRLLDRMEKTSPEFKSIYQWFKTPPGELLENQVVFSMYPLVEVAVKNGWTSVLFDPTTEGLVNDCLTYWGANGKHELVEKTVGCLAEGLSGDISERSLALTHLMDARPWVRNPELLEKVLGQLNSLLANETYPSLYQSSLLLAWDLMGYAMENGKESSVLTLLSTLHFHADEDNSTFPERSHIARHWLFERSTPELVRRFVHCAYRAGQLHHYPLLGEMAAPLLLEDFFLAPSPEKPAYYQLFAEIKEPIQSSMAEWLADIHDEADVQMIIPVLRVSGIDAALSLQLCSWIAKGSRELKMNLIGLIEESNHPEGGPALRLALFDDSEEIAAMAARVIGKIHFTPGIPVLLKAAKIREGRFENNDFFLISLCQSLGDLGKPEGVAFLQDIARKKPILRGKNFSLPVRLEAIQALTKINKPEVWTFLGSLMEEKNPALQETLDKIIHAKIQTLS